MIVKRAAIAMALLAVILVSLDRSHSETPDESANPVLVTRWYWGRINFDSDCGSETVEALLYIREVRPRGYFIGNMWYLEADEILLVTGRLTPPGYLSWFSVVCTSYAVDPQAPTPRGERMFFYKNLGYDYGIRRALGGVVTKATWHLQPVLLEQEEH